MTETEYKIKISAFFENLSREYQRLEYNYKNEITRFIDDTNYKLNLFQHFKKNSDYKLSSKFNIFDIISPDENTLSDIIASILNTKGEHGQGDLFQNEFLKFCKNKGLIIDSDNFNVMREYPANGRIDIILKNNTHAIAIENKPFANDQEDQLVRYYYSLREKYNDNICLIYLNKSKDFPSNFSENKHKETLITLQNNNKFILVTFMEFNEFIKIIYKECQSEKYRYFLADFIKYINTTFSVYQER